MLSVPEYLLSYRIILSLEKSELQYIEKGYLNEYLINCYCFHNYYFFYSVLALMYFIIILLQ